jgi:AcrR family transcriptional regulator
MGIAERKEREKVDLRKSILTAAREVFLEKGFEQTSIRSIAQKIAYSPTTIYLYFKDKDAILYALHSEGFGLLDQQMRVLFNVADPFERMKAMGKVYMKFAAEHSDYYDLMFVQKSPMDSLNGNQEKWDEGQSAFDGLRITIQQCMDQGLLPFKNAEAGAFLVWSAMHGMCTLYDRGRCDVLAEDVREKILDMAFEEFVAMMEKFRR